MQEPAKASKQRHWQFGAVGENCLIPVHSATVFVGLTSSADILTGPTWCSNGTAMPDTASPGELQPALTPQVLHAVSCTLHTGSRLTEIDST